jgi:FMN-dependent NADH-azoreductase
VRPILGFIGLTDVTFIHAENQAREEAAVFFAAAAERIGGLVIDQISKCLPFERVITA